jgi:ABC-type branched-subunit amino acid transport system substrate-binding protein
MRQFIVRLALLVLGVWVANASAADPGVTPTSILIGQSAAFSGPASELGNEMRAGALAYFQMVNAAGGVNGRKIEMRSLDDGYEPDRAAANTKKLIDSGVFLLFGYVGTPTSNASKPIFTAAKVPFVGAFTGAESLRNPLNRYIFNIRASYFDETDKIVGQMTGQTLDKIAVFYQNDDYGKAAWRVWARDAKAQHEDRRNRHGRAQYHRRRGGSRGHRQDRSAGGNHDLGV